MKGKSAALIACAAGWLVHGSATEAQSVTVVYSFCSQQNCTDGQYPSAGVIDLGGMLYGTTSGGGADSSYGTVFSFDTFAPGRDVFFRPSGSHRSEPESGSLSRPMRELRSGRARARPSARAGSNS